MSLSCPNAGPIIRLRLPAQTNHGFIPLGGDGGTCFYADEQNLEKKTIAQNHLEASRMLGKKLWVESTRMCLSDVRKIRDGSTF